MDHIEVDFFLVSVNNGQPKNVNYNVLNSLEFPVDNRPNRPQKSDDGKDYLLKNKSMRPLVKYANFHFLLYLAKRMKLESVIQIANCIQNQKDVPADIENKVLETLKLK